jgi:tetratricopeptide (TPR) repeat protein
MQTLLEDFYDADDREIWDTAMALADKAIALFPGRSAGWAMRARVYNKLESTAAAKAAVAEAQELDARCPLAAWTEAMIRLDEGPQSYGAALAIVDRALGRHPGHYGCLLGRAWILSTMGGNEASLACNRLAMAAGPSMQRPIVNAAAVLDRLGRKGEATRLYEEIAAKRPDDGMLAYNTGTRLYEAGDYAKAIAHFDRARALLGEWNAVQHNRASALAALGRHREAVEEWSALLKREPDWDWPRMGRLKSLRALNCTAEAEADMLRLQGMSDLDIPTLWQLSGIYADDGEDLKAIGCLQRMIEKGETSARVYARMGNCRFELGDDAAAQPLLEQALALETDYASPHMVYAKLMHRLGKSETALEHAEMAIALEPAGDEPQRRVRGEILIELGRFDEAVPELEAYIEVHAGHMPAICKLTKALLELRRYRPALAHCKTLIDDDASDPWVQWMAACAYAGLKDNGQAIAHYEQARDLYCENSENEYAAHCQKEIDALRGGKGLFARLFGNG